VPVREMDMDLNLLRSRLEQELKHLTEKLEQLKADNDSIDNREGGWFGRRDEQANEGIELRKRQASEELQKVLLAEIEHALDKLNQGTYGLCDNCGQSIDPARLEAIPHANLCLNCKARQEKQ